MALHFHCFFNCYYIFQVPLAVPLRMFEVFTSVQSAEATLSYDEAVKIVGNTFLYLIKRGIHLFICFITLPDQVNFLHI